MKYIEMLNEYNVLIEITKELFDSVIVKVKIDSGSQKEILSALLLNKINYGFNASILLVNNGFTTESRHVFRAIIEAYFILKALEIDEENAIERLWTNEKIRYNKMKKKVVSNGKFPKKLSEFENLNIDLEGEGKTSVEEWARLAKSVDEYDYVYSLLSDTIHINHYSIKEYGTFVEDQLVSLDKKPTIYDSSLTFDALLRMILNVTEIVLKVYNFDDKFESSLVEIESKIDEVFQKCNPGII